MKPRCRCEGGRRYVHWRCYKMNKLPEEVRSPSKRKPTLAKLHALRRKVRRIVVATLALWALPWVTEALSDQQRLLECRMPQGPRIVLRGNVPDSQPPEFLRGKVAEAAYFVADRRGLDWYKFGLELDGPTLWPPGYHVVAHVKGQAFRDSIAMVMSPAPWLKWRMARGIVLAPGDLERKPIDGRLCVVAYVAFSRRGWSRADVDSITFQP